MSTSKTGSRYLDSFRRLNRDTRLFVTASAAFQFVFWGIGAVLFNLYLLRLGHGPAFIGLVNGAGLLVGAVACLPAGEVGRRWGSRRALLAGLAVSLVAWLLISVSIWIPEPIQAAWLVGAYCFACLGSLALYYVNTSPFLTRVAGEEGRNHAFSLNAALGSGAAFIGSLVAGLLPGAAASLLGTRSDEPLTYALSLLAAPVGLALAVTLFLKTGAGEAAGEGAAGAQATPGGVPTALILALSLVSFLMWAGVSSVTSFYNVYLDAVFAVSTAGIGTIMAIGRLLAVPAAMVAPLVLARLGQRRTYVYAELGWVLGAIGMALVARWQVAVLAYLACGVLNTLAQIGVNVLQMTVVPTQWRPAMSAGSMMAISLGAGALAFGGGQIIAGLGYRSLFLTGAVLIVAGLVVFVAYFGRRARQAPAAPSLAPEA